MDFPGSGHCSRSRIIIYISLRKHKKIIFLDGRTHRTLTNIYIMKMEQK